MQTKCTEINGAFKCECLIDISTVDAPKYTDAPKAKENNILISNHAFSCYPMCRYGTKIMYYSAVLAAMLCYYDSTNEDVPLTKSSNLQLPISGACLADGTDVLLDQVQANTLNAAGIITIIKMNGFRSWGNNTCGYPATSDPKDRYIHIRRLFSWLGNTFIKTFFEKVDDPCNYRLIESVVDDWNVYCSTLVSQGALADSKIEYIADENPIENIIDGRVKFHQYLAAYTPAESIENVLEFDPNMLSTALNGGDDE
jgi:hypothetical protein